MMPIRPLVHTAAYLFMLGMNYAFASGAASRKTVGEVSALYTTALTPAGFAFSIWGIIYLGLGLVLLAEWRGYAKGRGETASAILWPWFLATHLLNSAWIVAWTSEGIAVALLLIFGLLFSILRLIRRLHLHKKEAAFGRLQPWLSGAIGLYAGWVIAATVLNASSLAGTYAGDWQEDAFWPFLILGIAVLLYLLTFRLLPAPGSLFLAGAWAFWGIAKGEAGKASALGDFATGLALLFLGIFVFVFFWRWRQRQKQKADGRSLV
ncbi:MAG: hypothetical protein ACXIT9_03480 [Nitritalea sp.]